MSQQATLSVDSAEFTALFRRQPGGVAVVTADAGHGPVALTATSVTAVSVDPPLLVLSASDASSAAPSIVAAETIVVHLVDSGDLDIAKLAATSGADRFADADSWHRLSTGEPSYHRVERRIRARVVERVRAGTATVLVAEALEILESHATDAGRSRHPLVYHDRSWRVLALAGEESTLTGR